MRKRLRGEIPAARSLAHLRGYRFRFAGLAAGALAFMAGCVRSPSTSTSSIRITEDCQPGWSCM